MKGWRRAVLGWTGLAGGLGIGEPVVELAPYGVEAWHFDGLAVEVPAGVLRLEGAQIQSSGAGDVTRLLEQAAGIRFRSVTGNGMEGQPALRGFGDNSGLRVLVLVDGQVYNNPDMGSITWAGMDIGELESVEVLRGGQTVLYGNHAVSGVVKLATRRPGTELEARLGAEAGSDGLRRWRLGAGQQVGGMGLRGGGSWTESDGYRENAAAQAGTARLGWRAGQAGTGEWSGNLRYDEVWMEFPGPLSYQQMLEDPRQSAHAGGEESDSREWQATIGGEGAAGWGTWQVRGGVLQRQREWKLQGITADNDQRRGTFSPRARFGSGSDFLIVGADLGWDVLDYSDYLDRSEGIVRAWAEVDRVAAGSYVFGGTGLPGGIEASGGLRLERVETDNTYVHYREEQLRPELVTNRGTFPNPNYRDPPEADPALSYAGPIEKSGWAAELSLLKKLAPGLHAWAGWDRVYRYPALDESAAYQGYPLSDPLNSGLDPETGNNYEAGIKCFGANWQLGWTAFLLHLQDEIAFDAAARLNRNIGDTERLGMELDASYQTDRYGLSVHAVLVRAGLRELDGSLRLPLVPEGEAGLTAWLRPIRALRLQAHYRHLTSQVQGNDYANAFREIPGHGLVGVSAQWEPAAGFSLFLVVNNLLDKTHALSAYNGGFYPGSGRQAQVRLTYNF